MEFHADPPDEATFGGILGVGGIIVVQDDSLEEGFLPGDFGDNAAIGGAPQHFIIFSSRSPELLENVPWAEPFPQGYSAGKGVEIPDYPFDGFEPVDPSSVEIIIDFQENLDFVNWS